MAKLVKLDTPVDKLKAVNNCANAYKQDSNDAMGLWSVLYLSDGAEVMPTSNIWDKTGLHNISKGQPIDVVYKDYNVPRNGDLPETKVVQFHTLQEEIQ